MGGERKCLHGGAAPNIDFSHGGEGEVIWVLNILNGGIGNQRISVELLVELFQSGSYVYRIAMDCIVQAITGAHIAREYVARTNADSRLD